MQNLFNAFIQEHFVWGLASYPVGMYILKRYGAVLVEDAKAVWAKVWGLVRSKV